MKVAGYGRVSTVEQALKGTSLEEQKRQIKNECKTKEYELVKIYYDEGVSGKDIEHRPRIRDLINDAKAGKFELVMFTKLDRLSRNARDILGFYKLIVEELDLKVWCIHNPKFNVNDPTGKLIITFLAGIAEWERSIIRRRTAAGRIIKLHNKNIFPGTPPFGYYWDSQEKKIKVDEEQRSIYKQIVDMYLYMHFSLGILL